MWNVRLRPKADICSYKYLNIVICMTIQIGSWVLSQIATMSETV